MTRTSLFFLRATVIFLSSAAGVAMYTPVSNAHTRCVYFLSRPEASEDVRVICASDAKNSEVALQSAYSHCPGQKEGLPNAACFEVKNFFLSSSAAQKDGAADANAIINQCGAVAVSPGEQLLDGSWRDFQVIGGLGKTHAEARKIALEACSLKSRHGKCRVIAAEECDRASSKFLMTPAAK